MLKKWKLLILVSTIFLSGLIAGMFITPKLAASSWKRVDSHVTYSFAIEDGRYMTIYMVTKQPANWGYPKFAKLAGYNTSTTEVRLEIYF